MTITPPERRARIMAAVDADRWDDVEEEIREAVLEGLADDLEDAPQT